jgi:hypothetical protein
VTPLPGRLAARLVLAISAIAAAGGCGTEPSDAGPAVYRLAGADNTATGTLQCFASSWQYEGGGLVRHGDCDVALRGFEATLDTTVPMPELVLTARVRLQDGGATTWRVSLPATVQNNTVQYDFDRFVDPLTSEQVFIAPEAGTLVDGVLTLLMRVSSNNGLPDRTEYARLDPSVFVLTATGTLPTPSDLAPRYTGVWFSGAPADYCTPEDPGVPSRCFHQSFTLASGGGSWAAAYDQVVTMAGVTAGQVSVTASNLTVSRQNSFVRVASPGTATPNTPLEFEAEGSLVGRTLTLFTNYRLLDGSTLVSPIVARAE